MVLANDVAKYAITASNIGGIYNLTDGYHATFHELSYKISKLIGKRRPFELNFYFILFLSFLGTFLGKQSPLNYYKFKKMTKTLTFNDNKARTNFGWNPDCVLDKLTF
jgi:hypothetical protein